MTPVDAEDRADRAAAAAPVQTTDGDGERPVTLADVERLAARYARRRASLAETAREVRTAVEAAREAGRPGLLRRARAAARARDELEAAVRRGEHLFTSPRSRVLSGVRVGWRRPPARVEIPDEARTVAAIRERWLASDAARYLRTRTAVVRSAVRTLAAPVLEALGVAVVQPPDAPVVAAADDDLDRIVAALLDTTPAP